MQRSSKAALTISALFLAVWITVGYVFISGQPTEVQSTPLSKYVTGPPDAIEILELVNIERSKVGVKPLAYDAIMEENASWKANDMVTRDYWAHKLPGTDKVLDATHLDAAWQICKSNQENLAKNVRDSLGAMEIWMTSTIGHKEAILNADSESVGIGIAKQSDGTYIVAQHFCDAK